MPDTGHVVLVGLMGSGKSTVGPLLARRLGREYLDNDAMLVGRAGRSARDIAERDGLATLHRLEEETLVEACARPEPAVIGAAASSALGPAGAAALHTCEVVYLRASPAVLAARLAAGDDGHRPQLDLVALFAERDPGYQRLASRVVDADRPAEEVAQTISEALARP